MEQNQSGTDDVRGIPLRNELLDFQRMVHYTARSKGFWKHMEQNPFPRLVALMHSELSEALEADRRAQGDDKIAEELADCVIRILDTAQALMLPVVDKIIKKAEFNKTRPMMHGGKLY